MSRELSIVTRLWCDLCGETHGTPFEVTADHRVTTLARAAGWAVGEDDVCPACLADCAEVSS